MPTEQDYSSCFLLTPCPDKPFRITTKAKRDLDRITKVAKSLDVMVLIFVAKVGSADRDWQAI